MPNWYYNHAPEFAHLDVVLRGCGFTRVWSDGDDRDVIGIATNHMHGCTKVIIHDTAWNRWFIFARQYPDVTFYFGSRDPRFLPRRPQNAVNCKFIRTISLLDITENIINTHPLFNPPVQ